MSGGSLDPSNELAEVHTGNSLSEKASKAVNVPDFSQRDDDEIDENDENDKQLDTDWVPCACICDCDCCEACCCPCLVVGRIWSKFDDDYSEERYIPQGLVGCGCLLRWFGILEPWIQNDLKTETGNTIQDIIPSYYYRSFYMISHPLSAIMLAAGIMLGRAKHSTRFNLSFGGVSLVMEILMAATICCCCLLTQEEKTMEKLELQRKLLLLEGEVNIQMAQMVGDIVGAMEDAVMDGAAEDAVMDGAAEDAVMDGAAEDAVMNGHA